MSIIKEQLYRLCCEYISTREQEIKMLIADAQEASGNETKSSAGDKYETTREVLQQDINMNKARLHELQQQAAALELISPAQSGSLVVPGSLVYTTGGNFYIAIGAGKMHVEGSTFYAVSAVAPIAAKMLGQQAGYSFEINGKTIAIKTVA